MPVVGEGTPEARLNLIEFDPLREKPFWLVSTIESLAEADPTRKFNSPPPLKTSPPSVSRPVPPRPPGLMVPPPATKREPPIVPVPMREAFAPTLKEPPASSVAPESSSVPAPTNVGPE